MVDLEFQVLSSAEGAGECDQGVAVLQGSLDGSIKGDLAGQLVVGQINTGVEVVKGTRQLGVDFHGPDVLTGSFHVHVQTHGLTKAHLHLSHDGLVGVVEPHLAILHVASALGVSGEAEILKALEGAVEGEAGLLLYWVVVELHGDGLVWGVGEGGGGHPVVGELAVLGQQGHGVVMGLQHEQRVQELQLLLVEMSAQFGGLAVGDGGDIKLCGQGFQGLVFSVNLQLGDSRERRLQGEGDLVVTTGHINVDLLAGSEGEVGVAVACSHVVIEGEVDWLHPGVVYPEVRGDAAQTTDHSSGGQLGLLTCS